MEESFGDEDWESWSEESDPFSVLSTDLDEISSSDLEVGDLGSDDLSTEPVVLSLSSEIRIGDEEQSSQEEIEAEAKSERTNGAEDQSSQEEIEARGEDQSPRDMIRVEDQTDVGETKITDQKEISLERTLHRLSRALRRIAYRAGVRFLARFYPQIEVVITFILRETIEKALIYLEYNQKSRVTVREVLLALSLSMYATGLQKIARRGKKPPKTVDRRLYFQRFVQSIMPAAPVRRVIVALFREKGSKPLFSPEAVLLLQFYLEEYLTRIFRVAQQVTLYRGRSVVKLDDFLFGWEVVRHRLHSSALHNSGLPIVSLNLYLVRLLKKETNLSWSQSALSQVNHLLNLIAEKIVRRAHFLAGPNIHAPLYYRKKMARVPMAKTTINQKEIEFATRMLLGSTYQKELEELLAWPRDSNPEKLRREHHYGLTLAVARVERFLRGIGMRISEKAVIALTFILEKVALEIIREIRTEMKEKEKVITSRHLRPLRQQTYDHFWTPVGTGFDLFQIPDVESPVISLPRAQLTRLARDLGITRFSGHRGLDQFASRWWIRVSRQLDNLLSYRETKTVGEVEARTCLYPHFYLCHASPPFTSLNRIFRARFRIGPEALRLLRAGLEEEIRSLLLRARQLASLAGRLTVRNEEVTLAQAFLPLSEPPSFGRPAYRFQAGLKTLIHRRYSQKQVSEKVISQLNHLCNYLATVLCDKIIFLPTDAVRRPMFRRRTIKGLTRTDRPVVNTLIGQREIRTALRLIFPAELQETISLRIRKATSLYLASNGNNQRKNQKAGLALGVGGVERMLRRTHRRLARTTGVQVVAIIETVVETLLDQASLSVKKRFLTRHLSLGIQQRGDLIELFREIGWSWK